MRRTLALLTVAAVGCTEDVPEDPPLDGFYRELTWTCQGTCPIVPPVTAATVLEIRGRSLHFTNESGLSVFHGAADFLDGCLMVDGATEQAPVGVTALREPYEACGEHPSAGMTITWTRIQGADPSTWRLAARFR
jgi:hypothetical protein